MEAKWITAEKPSAKTSLYLFSKCFFADKTVKSFTVRVSADSRYRLFLNGNEICHGPCHGSGTVKYFEEVECSGYLNCGENKLSAEVLYLAEPRHFTTMPRKDMPAFYFEGIMKKSDGEERIISDKSFSVSRIKNIEYNNRPGMMWSLCPFENVYGEREYEEHGCLELYTPCKQRRYHGAWGEKEKYFLKERPIPLLSAKNKTALSVVREYVSDDGKYNIVFDAGKYTTAMLEYQFMAEKGTKMCAIYAECPLAVSPDGTLYKHMRDNADGVIDTFAYDVFTASGNAQTHSPFYYRAFRFIRVECDKKPEYFSIYSSRYTYDFEKAATGGGIGSFECSDPRYMKMWEVSRNTLECSTHEIFVDCPFYEQQQYVGDGRFEALYAWRLSNDSSMQKKLLLDTVSCQQDDGQFAGNYPNSNVQILTVCTFYFVSLMREYLRYTGDTEFIKTLTGVCDRALQYYENCLDENGLVFLPEGCLFVDWVSSWNTGVPQGDKNKPLTIYSLMYASALKDAAEVCEACGRKGLADDYRARHSKVINAVNSLCYDTEKGLYTDRPGFPCYCEHTSVWAILSDAVTGEEAAALAERTMNSRDVAKCSFSKHYDTLRAFEKISCYQKYAPDILSQWDKMLEKNCTTWCEDPVTERSECHGWSCIPMYEASAMILGVNPAEDGYRKVKIKPHVLDLEYAKGRVPTPFGYIDVSWENKDGKFTLDVFCSEPVEMEIVCPGGKTERVFAEKFSVTE